MAQQIWKTQKLKRLFKIKNGGTPKSTEPSYWEPGEIVWITPEDLSSRKPYINDSIRKISKEGLRNSSASIIKSDSIVLSTRAPIGNVKIVKTPYATNQGCKSLERNIKTDTRYFYYYLSIISEHLNLLGRGTTFLELSNESLRNIQLTVPNLIEQKNIGNFLDNKTSEIDDLIADKERLIELLEEKRQAVITETVTKGLDPNVAMKDSGIEWIGDIPEHWGLKKLKYIVDLKNKKSSTNNSLPYIGLENVSSKSGKLLNFNISSDIESDSLLFKKGDVLFGKLRPYLRKCIIAPENGHCSSEFLVLRTKEGILDNKFLKYIMLSHNLIETVNSSTFGAKMPRANWEFIRNIYIPLPSYEEQRYISDLIDEKLTNIDKINEKINTQISKLKEYRESLIYEAVTGKIDVRDYAAETEEV